MKQGRLVLVGLALLGGLLARPALASGDMGCEVSWTVHSADYSQCTTLPYLSPGNDSRENLRLLLVDRGLLKVKLIKPAAGDDSYYSRNPGVVPWMAYGRGWVNFYDPKRAESTSEEDKSRSSGYGEADRNNSNVSGTAEFIAALKTGKGIRPEELAALVAARNGAPLSMEMSSRDGKEFATYLRGAQAFYAGEFAQAAAEFTEGTSAKNAWVRETSSYMMGRNAMVASQVDFAKDWTYDLSRIDADEIEIAGAAFQAYLKTYPKGRYASSARGLMRRVHWLSGDAGKLADELNWQIANTGSPQNNLSIEDYFEEADRKVLLASNLEKIRDPSLLATLDLIMMRNGVGPKYTLTLPMLQAQKGVFADNPGLHQYLLAAYHFFVLEKADAALAYLPKPQPTGVMDYVQFSQQTLRGLILQAKGDFAGERQHLVALLPRANDLQKQQLQLAIAINDAYAGRLASMFEAGSLVTDPTLRELVIRRLASPELLRQLSADRALEGTLSHAATYVLLRKDLRFADYKAFNQDYGLLPAMNAGGYDKFSDFPQYGRPVNFSMFQWKPDERSAALSCPDLKGIAERLAKNRNEPMALLCYGEFARQTYAYTYDEWDDYDGDEYDVDDVRTPVIAVRHLDAAPSQFKGTYFPRQAAYRRVIADKSNPAALHSYALYRGVMCYSPSGNNDCGGKSVDVSERKAWFTALKRQYPDSRWAKELQYYW